VILGQQASAYFATLLIFFAVDAIAAWGFDVQFGTTGVPNLAFLTSQAVGAYVAAMLVVGPPGGVLGQQYLFGATLPFPVAWLGAIAAGAFMSMFIGVVVAPRLRGQYFAIVTLVIGVGFLNLVSAYSPLFNGDQGIAGVPLPLTNSIVPTSHALWVMAALACGCMVVCFLFQRRLLGSPLSRRLRALRDNEAAAMAVGIHPTRVRLLVMGVGGALAGLSGALLVNAFGAWSPSSWQLTELLIILTLVLIGGSGNPVGVVLGVAVVAIGIAEGIQFIPGLGSNGTITANVQTIVISVLEIGFLWFRPAGLIPEKVRSRLRHSAPTPVDGDLPWNPRVSQVTGGGPLLSVKDLRVEFGGVVAVDGCTFSLESGMAFLVGPNGAGKSTTMACIAGATGSRSGSIKLGGANLVGPVPKRVESGVVRTFQLPQEFGSMTVLENVMVAIPRQIGAGLFSAVVRFRRKRDDGPTQETALKILDLCGLQQMADEVASKLSGGQKKLLELARALACRPLLLLLDEPTAGVSPLLSGQLVEVLDSLRSRGISMLIVTHEMSMIEALGGTVIVMANGRVLAEGLLHEIQSNEEVQEVYLGHTPAAAI
jgi:branched-chain amino acid transport system permease protein